MYVGSWMKYWHQLRHVGHQPIKWRIPVNCNDICNHLRTNSPISKDPRGFPFLEHPHSTLWIPDDYRRYLRTSWTRSSPLCQRRGVISLPLSMWWRIHLLYCTLHSCVLIVGWLDERCVDFHLSELLSQCRARLHQSREWCGKEFLMNRKSWKHLFNLIHEDNTVYTSRKRLMKIRKPLHSLYPIDG